MPSPTAGRVVAICYGVVCHLLFVAGVGTMMFEMAYGMSGCRGTLPVPWGAGADVLLLLQFPLAHSALLSRRGRRLLGCLAPLGLGGALSTTTYVAIASAQVLLLFLLWTPTGIVWWRAEGVWLVVILCLYATSWLLLLKSIRDAGLPLQVGLTGWWAVAHGRKPVYPPMPQRGLFRLCRQPIYVSFSLALWTVPRWTPDQLAVATVLTLYCLLGPLFKEARFAHLFGAEFAGYRASVPYWLPRMRAWPRVWPRAAGRTSPR